MKNKSKNENEYNCLKVGDLKEINKPMTFFVNPCGHCEEYQRCKAKNKQSRAM